MKIELQIRSELQHIWATAVETAGTFNWQPFKSDLGDPVWLRFFALMSTVLAMQEGMPPVPGTPSLMDELISELRDLDHKHHIVSLLSNVTAMLPHVIGDPKAKYYLLTLDPDKNETSVKTFRRNESQRANKERTEL